MPEPPLIIAIVIVLLILLYFYTLSGKKEGYYDPVSGARIMTVSGYNPLRYVKTYDRSF